MKRLTILSSAVLRYVAKCTLIAVILAGFTAVCLGRYDSHPPSKIIRLPEPQLKGPLTLEQTLAKRRSIRQFTNQRLTSLQIGQLAWAAQGITNRQRGYRTAPSAGAIYPMKLYFATDQGLSVYNPEEHVLEEIANQDIRSKLSAAALRQRAVAAAACDIIIAGSESKLARKYGNKARRYMLLEAGHIAQNIQLQAVGLQLGSVTIGAFDIRGISRICRLPADLEPLYIISVGYPARQATTEKTREERQASKMDVTKTKKAVLIIASENFRDEELFETKRELEKANIKTVIASTKMTVSKGMLGAKAQPEILVDELSVDDYDAIIFVGGSGARQYFDSPTALNIARQAKNKGKVLAAICIAPTVLANAGLLDGVRATSFSSEQAKLKNAGAKYTGAAVEKDGLIITGRGPDAATQFGKTIADALTGK